MAESEPIHDLLVCSVCYQRFKQPKVLPCQHTFCLNCLRGVTKLDARTLNCPLCRERHHVPKNGITGIKDNLVIKDLLSIVGDECHDCKKPHLAILTQCSHCEQQVCEICLADHKRLQTEITTLLQSFKKGIPKEKTDDKTDWQTALDNTLKEEAKVKTAFKEATTALQERSEQLLRPIQNTARFQKALIEKNEDGIIERFQQELRSCETVESLRVLQESLSDAAKVLSSVKTLGTGPKFSCDMSDITEFGKIVCGKKKLSNETTNIPFRAHGRQLTNKTPHASSVDYKSKNSSWKRLITQHPDKWKKFNPTFALYSHHNDSIFCISNNLSLFGMSDYKLLLFNMNGKDGRIVFPAINVRHIAITKTSQLLFTDGQNVMRANLKELNDANPAYSRIRLCCKISRVSQLCCFGREFVVLDSEKQCLTAFSEVGKLFRQLSNGKLRINENSRMCVDQEGRIYITSAHVTELRTSTSVAVTVKSVIVVLSWEGEFVEEIEIDGWSRNYEYTFDGPSKWDHTGVRLPIRNKDSVPSDAQIIRENSQKSICGICVDADGYICITKTGKNQIFVYNPKRELHCTIDDPVERPGEFKAPTGVSLMPDGRMIVCDTGNNQIQIIS